MSERQYPRLGDRADLHIEIPREAVTLYLLGLEKASLGSPGREEAKRDLLHVLRASYVTSSIGDSMSTRYRSGARKMDVQADLTRVSPTLVRVVFVSVRYDRRTGGGSGHAAGVFKIRSPSGKALGYLRWIGHQIEYRDSGSERWDPPPFELREVAAEQARRGYPAMERWLAQFARYPR